MRIFGRRSNAGRGRAALLAASVLVSLLAGITPSRAANLVVVTVNTDPVSGTASNCPGTSCSLRDALQVVAADAGNFYTITFDHNLVSTITLTSTLVMGTPVAIDGGSPKISLVPEETFPAFELDADDSAIRNLVIGGFEDGIYVRGSNNKIQGNFIGTTTSGMTENPNGTGISIGGGGAFNNLIGGTGPGQGNVIAFNTGVGVDVGVFDTGNTISANSIFNNGGKGIRLLTGEDTPGNNGQPAPSIFVPTTTAVPFNVPATVAGSNYRVEVFSGCPGDDNEGRFFRGAGTITNSSGGTATGVAFFSSTEGTRFTATATNTTTGDTSEFSGCSDGAAASNPPPSSPPPSSPPPSSPPPPTDPNQTQVACSGPSTCSTPKLMGPQTTFQLTISKGVGTVTGVTKLNGGVQPDCEGKESADDWVEFHIVGDASTWAKKVTMTGNKPMSKKKALKSAKRGGVCFAAPYLFETDDDTPPALLDPVSHENVGLLAACKTKTPTDPCISARRAVKVNGKWREQVEFKVPPNSADPRGRRR